MLGKIVNEDSSRARRRLMVTLMYLGYAVPLTVFVVGSSLVRNPDAPVPLSAWLLLLALNAFIVFSLVAFSALRAAVQRVADQRDTLLDERQTTVRNDAYRHAYHIFTGAVSLPLMYIMAAASFGWWLPPASNLGFMYGAIAWLMITLPTSVVAWTEPDPVFEPENAFGTREKVGS